ncbi:hypothetical protein ACFSHR_04560 [Azotobacter chroococcum]
MPVVGGVFRRLAIEGQGMLRRGLGQAGQAEQQAAAGGEQEGAQWTRHRSFSVDFSHQARRPRV